MKKNLILISFFLFALLLSSCDIMYHSILAGATSYVKIDLDGATGPNGELYTNTYYTVKGTIADGWGDQTGDDEKHELKWSGSGSGNIDFPNGINFDYISQSGDRFTIRTDSFGSNVTIKAKAINWYERPEKSLSYKLISRP